MRLSIRSKLMVPLVLGLAGIAVATAILMGFVHEQAVDAAALREVERSAEALDAQEESELDRLGALSDALLASESLAEALGRRDRAALLAEAGPMFRQLHDAHGVTHWLFHDPDPARGVLLRVHQPELQGDVVTRPTFRRAVETGHAASGREFGQTAYAVRVVRPWLRDGKVVGYLELGTDIHTFLARLKRASGDDYALLLDKRLLDSKSWGQISGHPERWEERPELLAVAATDGGQLFGRLGRLGEIPPRPALTGRHREGGRTFSRGLLPLRGADGAVLGALVVQHEITPLLAGTGRLRLQVVVLVVLLAAALASLVRFLLETLVFDRVERMSRVLEALPERLTSGDWSAGEQARRSDDEIGRVEGFLDTAMAAVGSFVTDARRTPTSPGLARRRSEGDSF